MATYELLDQTADTAVLTEELSLSEANAAVQWPFSRLANTDSYIAVTIPRSASIDGYVAVRYTPDPVTADVVISNTYTPKSTANAHIGGTIPRAGKGDANIVLPAAEPVERETVIVVQHTDGTFESVLVTPSQTAANRVLLQSPLSQPYVENSRVLFTITTAAVSFRTRPCLVVEKELKDGMVVAIRAINYADQYYANDSDYINGLILDPVDDEGTPYENGPILPGTRTVNQTLRMYISYADPYYVKLPSSATIVGVTSVTVVDRNPPSPYYIVGDDLIELGVATWDNGSRIEISDPVLRGIYVSVVYQIAVFP